MANATSYSSASKATTGYGHGTTEEANLLLETGDRLLQEDGDAILLDLAFIKPASSFSAVPKPTSSYASTSKNSTSYIYRPSDPGVELASTTITLGDLTIRLTGYIGSAPDLTSNKNQTTYTDI